MADCCTPGTGFPTGPQMAQLSLNLPVVWEEICKLQQAILAAASQCQPGGGQMCVTVGGDTPMTFVSGVSSVTVNNGGSGYFVDKPAIAFIPPNGSAATGATATLTTNGSNILAVNMTNGSSGYQPISSTLAVSSLLGTGANLQPLVNASGQIVNVNIVSAGSGYTINDTITATRAVLPNIFYVDAVFKITAVSVTGEIVHIAITNPGSGYEDSVTTVKIVSTLNPLLDYPLGAGFQGSVITDNAGTITDVLVDNIGAGYSNFNPYLVITDPGTGATTKVNLTGTAVSSVDVLTSGSNYTPAATGTIYNPPTAALPNPPASPAVVTINTNQNTFGTDPHLYWQVWAGTTTNKPIQSQLNAVLSYFGGLGYTIKIQSNPQTGSTIQWKICW